MSNYGPNVTKLITKFIAREAVPPGGGLASALEFFSNPEQRKQVLDSAEAKAIQAIQAIKSAPDNPFGDDDERIAGELLAKIQERHLTPRAADLRYARRVPCTCGQDDGLHEWDCAISRANR